MALINCSECGKQVSDRAASCPNCGNPIAQIAGPTPTATRATQVYTEESKPVTTQQTGKGPKVVQLIGGVLILLGVASCVLGGPGSSFQGVGIALVGVVV